MTSRTFSLAVLVTLCAACGTFGVPRYELTLPDTFGGPWGTATDISNTGYVVGHANTAPSTYHAFIWRNGVMKDLGTLGGASSFAYGVNDFGDVAGSSDTATGSRHASLWRQGEPVDLGSFGGNYADAFAVNNSLEVVGGANYYSGGQYEPFYSKDGLRVSPVPMARSAGWLTDINDSGHMVGFEFDPVVAFLIRDGVKTILEARSYSGTTAYAINAFDEVVGSTPAPGGTTRAFIWRNGTMIVDPNIQWSSEARDVNNHGQVVGEFWSPNFALRAFLWEGGRMFDLTTLIAAPPGVKLVTASAINDAGVIVGTANDNGRNLGFVLTPVPEPSSILLLAAGTVGIAAFGGCRRVRCSAHRQVVCSATDSDGPSLQA